MISEKQFKEVEESNRKQDKQNALFAVCFLK